VGRCFSGSEADDVILMGEVGQKAQRDMQGGHDAAGQRGDPSADIAGVLDQLLATAGSTDLDAALVATTHILAVIGAAQSSERFAVTPLRRNGATWAQIGRSLNAPNRHTNDSAK